MAEKCEFKNKQKSHKSLKRKKLRAKITTFTVFSFLFVLNPHLTKPFSVTRFTKGVVVTNLL